MMRLQLLHNRQPASAPGLSQREKCKASLQLAAAVLLLKRACLRSTHQRAQLQADIAAIAELTAIADCDLS
jgi:hypothetical protein